MKPKLRVILEQAINEGITIGYRRAFKHTETPTEAWVIENIENEIMNYIDLYFDFEEQKPFNKKDFDYQTYIEDYK